MIRSLYLLTPLAIASQFPDIKGCHLEAVGDGQNTWLKLFVSPGNWSVNDDYFSESKYEPTFKRMRLDSPYEVINRGYSITILDGNASLFYLVEQLSRTRPISVRDYLRPESAQFVAARVALTSPYTERTGVISKVKPNGPLVGTFGASLGIPGGFSFEFKEGVTR